MGTGLSISSSMFASQPWMTSSNVSTFAPMSMGTSIYSTTSSSGSGSSYSTANETAEQREKRIERELKKKNEAIDAKTKKAQEELIAQMQQNPDMFAELTEEEEKILLEYMTKVDKAENGKGAFDTGNMMQLGSTAMTCAYTLPLVGTALSYGGSALSWCGKKVGLDKVGNYVADSKLGQGVSSAYNTAKNSNLVQGSKSVIQKVNAAPASVIDKAASTASMGEKAGKFVNWSKGMTNTVANKGAIAAAVVTVTEDMDELAVAYKDGVGSGLKQTGQTAVKAGAAAGGFWAGAKGGAFLGAKVGACFGPVGAAVGGLLGGLAGGLFGSWGAKKVAKAVVGKDVGDKIREQQALEAANAQQGTELSESQMMAVGNVLAYAQQDQEIDEKTMAVLNKLAARTGMV